MHYWGASMSSGNLIHHTTSGVFRMPPRGVCLKEGSLKHLSTGPIAFWLSFSWRSCYLFCFLVSYFFWLQHQEKSGAENENICLICTRDQILSTRWVQACVQLSIIHMAKTKNVSMYVSQNFYLRLKIKF